MNPRVLFTLLALLLFLSSAQGEITALPFFLEPASFPENNTFCGQARSWMDFEQILNQQDSPDFAHNLNLGGVFQLYATPRWSWSLTGNEVFEFKAFPGNPLLFDPRALLTNVIVMSDLSLGETTVEFWLQHDCNHSVDQAPLRDSVHTSVSIGASLGTQERVVLGQPLTFGVRVRESVVIPLYYQDVSPEPQLESTGLELHWLPMGKGHETEVFVDANTAILVNRTDTPVSISPVTLDARGVVGVDFSGAKGKIRVFYRLDRTSDPEISNSPVVSLTSTCGVETLFD
jgi:hypothetical protein